MEKKPYSIINYKKTIFYNQQLREDTGVESNMDN